MLNKGSLKSYGAGSMLIRLAFIAACSETFPLDSEWFDCEEESSSDELLWEEPERGSGTCLCPGLLLYQALLKALSGTTVGPDSRTLQSPSMDGRVVDNDDRRPFCVSI